MNPFKVATVPAFVMFVVSMAVTITVNLQGRPIQIPFYVPVVVAAGVYVFILAAIALADWASR